MSDLVTSVREGLDVFFAPGPELIEVRILKTPKKTISGYFDSLDLAVAAVEDAVDRYATTTAAFYATMNSVTRAVHPRALNRLKPYADVTTVDADIQRRHYFLIDFDPRRPKGVSSTDAELAEALRVRDAVMAWLSAEGGWPAGLRAMSGNGGHADYLVDLPNDAATRDLFKACLAVLHQRFATPTVDIDRAVYNAARICKIYGTVARKGDATPERPHRRAEIEERPIFTAVTREQLQWLAAHAVDARPSRPGAGPTTARARPPEAAAPGDRLDMRAEFDARGCYLGELHNGWHAVRCPWIDAHSGTSGISETAIREPDTVGSWWGFKCQHASCAERTIRDVWEVFRPHEARARPGAEMQPSRRPAGLDSALLEDVTVVVAQGKQIARDGVPCVVDGLIPALGMVGALVAYAKVGKTTFGLHLAGAVACGTPLLDLATRQVRVLVVAAEDPPEYTAFVARHQTGVPEGQLTFYRQPIQLDAKGLAAISGTVKDGGYGLVLISSWQSVVATLVRDENDNAGGVRVMDTVKTAARATGVPWLIDAHSGKGEDQRDEADPIHALRGASAVAGAADFILSLRYADSPFGTKRRLSGKGRFVSFAPILMEFDAATGTYTALGATKTAMVETTWRMIVDTDALTTTPQGTMSIAVRAGLAPDARSVSGALRRQIDRALRKRPGVRTITESRGHKTITRYAREEPSPDD